MRLRPREEQRVKSQCGSGLLIVRAGVAGGRGRDFPRTRSRRLLSGVQLQLGSRGLLRSSVGTVVLIVRLVVASVFGLVGMAIRRSSSVVGSALALLVLILVIAQIPGPVSSHAPAGRTPIAPQMMLATAAYQLARLPALVATEGASSRKVVAVVQAFDRRLVADTKGLLTTFAAHFTSPLGLLPKLEKERSDVQQAIASLEGLRIRSSGRTLELTALELFDRTLAALRNELTARRIGEARRFATAGQRLAGKAGQTGQRAAKALGCLHHC